jgi:hypothetical protein
VDIGHWLLDIEKNYGRMTINRFVLSVRPRSSLRLYK